VSECLIEWKNAFPHRDCSFLCFWATLKMSVILGDPFVKRRRVTGLMHLCCSHTYCVAATMTSVLVSLIVRLQPVQLCLLHLWVHWKMKTTALFVQVYFYTSMYLVWDIPKWYVWRTVGHVQYSLWSPGLHTRGDLCPK